MAARVTCAFNTLKPRRNYRHFPDGILIGLFLNKNLWISIKISLKFVPMGPINNIPALIQIMAWRQSGDKPLSEPMLVSLLTHICVTRPQWVKCEVQKRCITLIYHNMRLLKRFRCHYWNLNAQSANMWVTLDQCLQSNTAMFFS